MSTALTTLDAQGAFYIVVLAVLDCLYDIELAKARARSRRRET